MLVERRHSRFRLTTNILNLNWNKIFEKVMCLDLPFVRTLGLKQFLQRKFLLLEFRDCFKQQNIKNWSFCWFPRWRSLVIDSTASPWGGLTTNYFSQSRLQVETRRHVGRPGRELPRCFSTKWHFKIRALFVKLDCGSNRSCKVCPLFRNYPFENV